MPRLQRMERDGIDAERQNTSLGRRIATREHRLIDELTARDPTLRPGKRHPLEEGEWRRISLDDVLQSLKAKACRCRSGNSGDLIAGVDVWLLPGGDDIEFPLSQQAS